MNSAHMSVKKRRPAILGGSPAFKEPLHVGRPNLRDLEQFVEQIRGIFDRNWITNNGPLCREFERRIADRLGVRNCVATSSGTAALQIAVRALGLEGEVIVPSFTFVATAHALRWQQINPVFCDIDPRTHNIDPDRIAELVTPRTTGILAVHLWGRPCDVQSLEALARRHGLALLFDASHAFDCTRNGAMIGRFGNAEVFSFHATKFVHAGEGGAIATNDDDLADRMRLMRNFGFAGYDQVASIGINGKMSELNAALGLTSIEHIDEFAAVNRRNYRQYQELLPELPGLSLLPIDPLQRRNCQYVVVEVDAEHSPLTRDELVAALHAENVLARRYFYPGCHRMQPYHTEMPSIGRRLPNTVAVSHRVMQLPTGTNVSPTQLETVVECLRRALTHANEIRTAVYSPGYSPRKTRN